MLTEEDEEFMNNMADEPGKDSGCTAVVALIRGNELYVANAGKSEPNFISTFIFSPFPINF